MADEVLADRNLTQFTFVVSDGWFGTRRFLVPLEEVTP
jgi:hypothetical protein